MKPTEMKKWFVDRNHLYFASIELTQCCNFHCLHCYCTGKGQPFLSADQYMAIIDRIAETGCLFLNFTGGEILTNPDFEAIYRHAKDKGFVVDLLTNGSLITDRHIALFRELPPRSIAITLYGTNAEEYAGFTGDAENFRRVMHALDLLRANDIPFVLRTVAVRAYKASLMARRFEEIAEKYGTTFKYDSIIFPQLNGNNGPLSQRLSVDEIIALEKCNAERCARWHALITDDQPCSWTCRAGVNSMAVDHRGDAHVCGLYRAEPISVLNNDIAAVLKHLASVHEKFVGIVNSGSCGRCSNRKVCKWCPAYAGVFTAELDKPVPFFCDLAEARVKNFGGSLSVPQVIPAEDSI